MTEAVEISPNINWIGINDRTTDLFEGMWPIVQEGVTYNSYLVDGGKKALIDLTKSLKGEDLLRQIGNFTDVAALDYIVVNHMEPDHTGVLKMFQRLAPKASFLCTEKAVEMLKNFYGITNRIQVVRDGETISLGKIDLQFFETPFVHWPETMMTYIPQRGILFSCDGFGGFGAFEGVIFDDQANSLDYYEREALRYFSNIVAKYSRMVLRAIDKLASVPVRMIAPSHGLVWRAHPERILDLYKTWSTYALEPARAEVTLIYASMYGATETMMNAVAHGVAEAGVPLQIFDAAHRHASYILPSLWTRHGVIVGAPTYEGNIFPPMASLLGVAEQKGVKGKKAAYFGSYGWSGGGQGAFQRIAESMNWQVLETLTFTGNPAGEDLKAGEAFGARFAAEIKNPAV
jgi:flavorubredoxin